MKQVKYSFGGAIDRFRPFFFAAALCLTTSLGAQSPFPDEGMPETDFRPIFDGRTLDGWTYDPVYWRVEEGCIVGEVTPETLLERNSFIIWRGDAPADFELKMEYRVSAEGNSGINYRSSEVPGVPDALRGYQLDIDGPGRMDRTKLRGAGPHLPRAARAGKLRGNGQKALRRRLDGR